MDKQTTADLIETEKNFYKQAKALLENKDDKNYFNRKTRSLDSAEKLAKTDEQKELLLNNYVQTRHQIVFLLFRRRALTENLANSFYEMMSIEEANRRYADKEDERKERQKEMNDKIAVLREEENRLDIFKAVLTGMSEEKAKEELKKYQQGVAQAIKGQ